MLLDTSSSWPGVAMLQSGHIEVGTVAEWDANLFAYCSAPVVVVPPAKIPSTHRSMQQMTMTLEMQKIMIWMIMMK